MPKIVEKWSRSSGVKVDRNWSEVELAVVAVGRNCNWPDLAEVGVCRNENTVCQLSETIRALLELESSGVGVERNGIHTGVGEGWNCYPSCLTYPVLLQPTCF